MRFDALFKLSPPGVFGLPDGDYIVVPVAPGAGVSFPLLDLRTGQVVSHGTLPKYRDESDRLSVSLPIGSLRLAAHDNFFTISCDSEAPGEAFKSASTAIDTLTQALGLRLGEVVTAELVSFTDEGGGSPPVQAPVPIALGRMRAYNLAELRASVERSAEWTGRADDRARKALYYFESALLLRDFSKSMTVGVEHKTFALAVALLQLYKGLSAIVGDPGTDKDYQSRGTKLGLPADFWSVSVKPVYLVRNDADVAHYSLQAPAPAVLHATFVKAIVAFRQALDAYVDTLPHSGAK